MVSFQLRSLPGTAWPAIPIPEVSQVWAAYLELNRTQWLSPDELEEMQLRQLRALLLHCFHEVEYYRRVLTDAGYPKRPIKSLSDFRRLPLLTRELYQYRKRRISLEPQLISGTASR
jgi:phenylacetate-coenzyme A ligase PaaK-like adenylate-forming protein